MTNCSGKCALCNSLSLVSVNSVNHLGPSTHKAHLDSSNGFAPHEGTSAGLSFPLRCRLPAGTRFLTSCTRCWTNCFHSLSWPWIQNYVTLESVQQLISVLVASSYKASLTCPISLPSTKAVRSSNREMDNCFTGATLDFDATNLT